MRQRKTPIKLDYFGLSCLILKIIRPTVIIEQAIYLNVGIFSPLGNIKFRKTIEIIFDDFISIFTG